jgi:hypothetical protein
MTNKELSKELRRIYLKGQQRNETALNIINYLEKNDSYSAEIEYIRNRDKIPKWSNWGKEFTFVCDANILK